MARAALTGQQIATFRAEAVAVATRLFAEQGVDRVTMRAVAAGLGCSAMKLYRYFDNRDELFAMVRSEAFARFADRQQRAYESAPDPVARLLAIKGAYVEFALDEPDAYRIMFELRQAPADCYPELDAQGQRGFSYLLKTVQEACAAELLAGDALTLAHLFWANTHGLVSLHLAGKLLGRSLEQLTDVTLELELMKRKT